MALSKRLQALADLVTPGLRIADVGCDHGFLSIYLVSHGICPGVFAMDVNSGPLEQARQHIRAQGLEKYIDVRLSDGLDALSPGEAQGMVCAGMGGRLMQRILTRGREQVREMKELILQPQSEISAFRCFLRENGYGIIEERMIWEEGKYYPMMRAVPGYMAPQPKDRQRLEDKFGPCLLEQKEPVLIQFLKANLCTYREILKKIRTNRGDCPEAETILREIRDMENALSYMEVDWQE